MCSLSNEEIDKLIYKVEDKWCINKNCPKCGKLNVLSNKGGKPSLRINYKKSVNKLCISCINMGSKKTKKIYDNVKDEVRKLFYDESKTMKFIRNKLQITNLELIEIIKNNNIIIPEDFNDNYYLYTLVYENDNKYCIDKNCPECNKTMIYSMSKSTTLEILIRNYRNSIHNNTLCKPCCKLGDRNSFFGKTHKAESINQISESRTGKCLGEDNAMANLVHRKKATDALKKKWDDGEMEHVREINRVIAIKNQASGLIKMTYKSKGETEVYESLKLIYTNIEKQKTITSKHFDLYIPSLNLLIEYNGDYWHCNPQKYAPDFFNKKKGMYAQELWDYDEKKRLIGEQAGYKCLTIWESDYKKNPNIVLEEIQKYI